MSWQVFFDSYPSPEIDQTARRQRGSRTTPVRYGGAVTVLREAARVELCRAGFAFCRSGDLGLFSRLGRNRYRIGYSQSFAV